MSTLHELIRNHLMDLVHQVFPNITLDGSGEPETARVLFPKRTFDHDEPRKYKLGTSGEPMTTKYIHVTADVLIRAELQLHSKDQMDLDMFLEAALQSDSVVWNWRGHSVRVTRNLTDTNLRDLNQFVRESVYFEFSAPFFKQKNIPVIADESYFDGWEFSIEEAS